MSTPTPQKIRKQRTRLLIGAVLFTAWGLMMMSVFICSRLWQVLVG